MIPLAEHEKSRTFLVTRREAQTLGLPVLVLKPIEKPVFDRVDLAMVDMRRRLNNHFGSGLPVNRRAILLAVCLAHRVPLVDLLATKTIRARSVSAARFRVYHELKERLNLSSAEIGRFLEVDHASVLYGQRKHRASLRKGATFPELKDLPGGSDAAV